MIFKCQHDTTAQSYEATAHLSAKAQPMASNCGTLSRALYMTINITLLVPLALTIMFALVIMIRRNSSSRKARKVVTFNTKVTIIEIPNRDTLVEASKSDRKVEDSQLPSDEAYVNHAIQLKKALDTPQAAGGKASDSSPEVQYSRAAVSPSGPPRSWTDARRESADSVSSALSDTSTLVEGRSAHSTKGRPFTQSCISCDAAQARDPTTTVKRCRSYGVEVAFVDRVTVKPRSKQSWWKGVLGLRKQSTGHKVVEKSDKRIVYTHKRTVYEYYHRG